MLFDDLLFENLSIIGNSLIRKSNLNSQPKNIHEIEIFLNTLKNSILNNEFDGLITGLIFFKFVTCTDVRDRSTTSRTFEDIFSALFGTKSTDTQVRVNPTPPKEILALNFLSENYDWNISTDLAGNRREKADLSIGDYNISLKTLKGVVIGKNGICLDNSVNEELNIGSLSFRSLFVGLLDTQLSDRMGGLGSGTQLREKVLSVIKERNLEEQFYNRLKLFLSYVYTDDVYIVLKSHMRITFILIPNYSFVNGILKLYEFHEDKFEKVWYRWENNNLRIRWKPLLNYLDEFKLEYKVIDIDLFNSIENVEINDFLHSISDSILNEISKYIVID